MEEKKRKRVRVQRKMAMESPSFPQHITVGYDEECDAILPYLIMHTVLLPPALAIKYQQRGR